MSFPEAVERIAEMAGVPMPARDPEAEKRDQQRASLTDVMELATTFFQEQLQSAAGAKARAYLRDRGLSSATQQSFRLGYALGQPQCAEGVPGGQGRHQGADGGLRAGVSTATTFRSPIDRFRDRVMFPIPDSRGRIIAFGGRALTLRRAGQIPELAGDRALPQGQRALQFRARPQGLQKDGTVIAVEGYMDVIALAQAGFENVVAPLGTALTENQLELLWRMARRAGALFRRRPGRAEGGVAGRRHGAAADPARAHAALCAAAGRQGPRRSGQGRRAGRVPRGARRGAAAGRPVVDARDLGRRVRHAGAAGRSGKDAARADRAASATRACATTTSRRCATACRPSSARSAAAARQRQDRASATSAATAGRAANGRGVARRPAASPSRKAWPARPWSSAPAASCRCAKRRSWWRWSTIRSWSTRISTQIESLDLGHPELRRCIRHDRCAWRMDKAGDRVTTCRGDRATPGSARPGSARSG